MIRICATTVVVVISWLAMLGYPIEASAQTPAPSASTTTRAGSPDIAGFALGMRGAEAEERLKAFYPAPGRDVYLKRLKLDPAQPSYLAFAAPSRYGLRDDEDNITLMFSGTASGNQLLYLTRDAAFPSGRRPDLSQTIAAIRSKYGEPSGAAKDKIEYFYRNGNLIKSSACSDATHRAAAVRRPMQGGSHDDYVAQANAALLKAPADCDAAMIFSFQIAQAPAGVSDESISAMSSTAIAFRTIEAAAIKDREVFDASLKSRGVRDSGKIPVPKL